MSKQRIAEDAAACSEICGSAATGSHGQCVNGSCICEAGYEGLGCTMKRCPNGCSNSLVERRGECIDGRCICSAGFGGSDCSITCPKVYALFYRSVYRQELLWSTLLFICDAGLLWAWCLPPPRSHVDRRMAMLLRAWLVW